MEDKISEIEEKITSDVQNSIKAFKKVHGLNEKTTIPNYQINKKIQKKLLKAYSKENHNNSNSISKKDEIFTTEEDKKTMIKKRIFPWSIVETKYIIEKNKIISSSVDYKDLSENYIKNIQDNEDKELIQFIENLFLLYNNKSPILRKIVKKPFSLALVEEKLYLWHYYIRSSSREKKCAFNEKIIILYW